MNTESPTNASEFTVSEISGRIEAHGGGCVRQCAGCAAKFPDIAGRILPATPIFSLKDDKSRLEAVVWRGSMSKLKFQPEEGMEVIATGKLTTFPGSSKYQIVIEQIEPAGAGALMALAGRAQAAAGGGGPVFGRQ